MATTEPPNMSDHLAEPARTRQSGSSICRMCGGGFGHVWYLCDGCARDPRRTYDRKIVIARALHLAEIAAAVPHRFRPLPNGKYEVYAWKCSICQVESAIKHDIPHLNICPFSVLTYEERDAADRFASECGQDDRLTWEEELERQHVERELYAPVTAEDYRKMQLAGELPRWVRRSGIKRSPRDARRARTRSSP